MAELDPKARVRSTDAQPIADRLRKVEDDGCNYRRLALDAAMMIEYLNAAPHTAGGEAVAWRYRDHPSDKWEVINYAHPLPKPGREIEPLGPLATPSFSEAIEAAAQLIDNIASEYLPGGPSDIKGLLRRVEEEVRALRPTGSPGSGGAEE